MTGPRRVPSLAVGVEQLERVALAAGKDDRLFGEVACPRFGRSPGVNGCDKEFQLIAENGVAMDEADVVRLQADAQVEFICCELGQRVGCASLGH
jgi:hypothetical protein